MTVTRVLVTGGSGFIGTHLVAALDARGIAVVNLDRKAPQLAAQAPFWCDADLMDRQQVDRIVRKARPDVIYNLAAVADISLGIEAMAPNTQGLSNLIAAATAVDTDPRLIHASTQLVVGPEHVMQGPREYAPYTEYGESKAASERIMWEEAVSIPWTIVRPATIWGPWHATFGDSIWKYINRRWYLLPTGSDPLRAYGYVGNAVDQLIAIIDAPAQAIDREVFYLGDKPVPASHWIDGFSRALTGRKARRVPGTALRALAEAGELAKRVGAPAPIDRGRHYRMTTDYPVPLDTTFRVLGKGAVDLETGIAHTVDWLRLTHPFEYAA